MRKIKPHSIDVVFVEPVEIRIKKRKLTREESGLRYDMSQFYSMKALLEQLFGNPTYMRLKETGSLKDWQNAVVKLLRAIGLSIELSVAVADDDWRHTIAHEVQVDIKLIKAVDRMDDLFCVLPTALVRIVFMQIGEEPSFRLSLRTIPLTKDFWRLGSYRTVQYVQSIGQKEAAARLREKRAANKAL